MSLYKAAVNPFTGKLQRVNHTSLTADDHAIYALLVGRSGGTIHNGSPDSGDDIELHSNASKDGLIKFGDNAYYDEATEILHLNSASSPALRLAESGSATSYSSILDSSPTRMELSKVANVGSPLIDMNPQATDGTSAAYFRFFRTTNTIGLTAFQVFKGDGTATQNASIAGNSSSYVNAAVGNFGIQETTPSKALDVKNGAAGGDILCYDIYTHDGGVETSDGRMKEDILSTNLGLDFIKRLNPVGYKWKDVPEITEEDGEGNIQIYPAETYLRTHQGLIAQEVGQVLTDMGLNSGDFAGFVYEEDRDRFGLRYVEFIAPLIKAVQELKLEIDTLKGAV